MKKIVMKLVAGEREYTDVKLKSLNSRKFAISFR